MTICETFAIGAFNIECHRIELTKGGQFPVSVAGPGVVLQNEDGYLEFKVHLSQPDFSTAFTDLNRPRVAGKMIPEDELWNLTACSYSGETWAGKVPDLGTLGLPIFKGGMIHGRVPILASELLFPTGTPNQESAILFLPNKLAFPAMEMSKSETSYGKSAAQTSINRDHSNFSSGTDEFLIAEGKECSWVQCLFPPGGIEEHRHVRIQEALMFALAQPVTPCALETTTREKKRTELRSFSKRAVTLAPKQMPPLFFEEPRLRPEVFKIAAQYYETIKPHKGATWSEITCHVYYLIHSANTVQEMSSLTLGVAAEGIACTCFASVAAPDTDFLRALERAEKKIAELSDHKELVRRISGALSPMRQPRNSDRLRAIVDMLSIDKKVYKAWQRTRNTAAHGSFDSDRDPSGTHDRNSQVLYLCYRMVLYHIGYAGLITDYSSTGMPNITV